MALKGLQVIEMAGLAPGPLCGMLLADFGARVIRVDRPSSSTFHLDRLTRGKQSIALDLTKKTGLDIMRELCKRSDVLIDTFRPGVMERLGLGPDILVPENPGLVFARLSGYGQTGPFAKQPGHDINYLGLCGVLSRLGPKNGKPQPPLNLLGDFAGGSLLCAFGILAALLERGISKKGQVLDAKVMAPFSLDGMLFDQGGSKQMDFLFGIRETFESATRYSDSDGTAYLCSYLWRSADLPIWSEKRGESWFDGGAPFYDTYECADGRFVAVGCIESVFFQRLLQGLGIEGKFDQFSSPSELGLELTRLFKQRTRDEWIQHFEKLDTCVSPVLSMEEAPEHPHHKSRGAFRPINPHDSGNSTSEPSPAPVMSRTPALSLESAGQIKSAGQDTVKVLKELGCSRGEIDALLKDGVVEAE